MLLGDVLNIGNIDRLDFIGFDKPTRNVAALRESPLRRELDLLAAPTRT